MYEIEIKIKLTEPFIVQRKLENIGCSFTSNVTQIDEVYVTEPDRFLDSWPGKRVMRIRNQNTGFLFTVKQHRSNPLDCEEFEKPITSPDEVRMIVQSLGYQHIISVRKVRKTCSHKGMTFCLDTVEGLGSFLEIEKLSTEQNTSDIQHELAQFIESELGLLDHNVITEGYDMLLYKTVHQ